MMRRQTRVWFGVLVAGVAAMLFGCKSDGAKQNGGVNVPRSAAQTAQFPVSIVTDGNFFVTCRVNSQTASAVRQVSKYKARRVGAPPNNDYSILVAENRAGNLGLLLPDVVTRPAASDAAITATTEELAFVMPEEGVIVVNGAAPIIQVKRVTVSSEGTVYAIETNGSGWLLKVLSTPNGPVMVDFGIPNTRPTPLLAPACKYCPFTANSPTQMTDGVAADCLNLEYYATDLLNGTN